MQKIPEPGAKPFVNWPPSIVSIEALDKNKPMQVLVMWPTGETLSYPIDDFTTIEQILTTKVFKERFFVCEPDPEMYWLFLDDHEGGFPMPISKEKRISKLIYQDEHEFIQKEEGIMLGQSRSLDTRR